MADVFRRPRAEADLLQIWLFVARENEAAADRILDRIDSALSVLANNPLAGRQRSELKAHLRSFVVGQYILYYEPIPSGIDLVRVINGSRDVDAGLIIE